MSTIEVAPEVQSVASLLLQGKHKFAIFKILDKKLIIVDHASEATFTENKEDDKVQFDKFNALLQKKEPRYCFYDFGFVNSKIKTLAFIFWRPDCSTLDKMIYASGKDTIENVLNGFRYSFEANDKTDMDYDTFAKKCLTL